MTINSLAEPPSVTVICLSFNHKPYLAKTLEGFRKQVVNFPVEFIVHDDASTDQSAEIITEYNELHPGLLRPILQIENQFSRGILIAPLLISKSTSKYIAWCEGDDYWTDPNKLARQIRILEADLTLAGTFHATDWLDQDKDEIIPQLQLPQIMRKPRIDLHDLLEFGCLPHTSSLVIRRSALEGIELLDRGRCTGDYSVCLYVARSGDLGFADESMSVYRAHAGGYWSPRSALEKTEWAINGLTDIAKELKFLKLPSCRKGLARKRMDLHDLARRRGDYGMALRELVLAIHIAPWSFRMKIPYTYMRRLLGNKKAKRGWQHP